MEKLIFKLNIELAKLVEKYKADFREAERKQRKLFN